jgi:lathosterol oxidase
LNFPYNPVPEAPEVTLDHLLDIFAQMHLPAAAFWLLVGNIILFLFALVFGHVLLFIYRDHRVVEPPQAVELPEIVWATLCVLLNTLVTIAGWWLWRHGIIVIRRQVDYRVAEDVVVLLISMDLLMYLFHRVAHLPWIYPWMHQTHHHYDKPRPLNLFVLNPFEVLGFGVLWLALITVCTFSWWGIILYLLLNVLFGTIGHLGVEPLPRIWMRLPILRHIGTSTFHSRHHQNRDVNFGFYTDIWDRLFRSLYKRYDQTFGRIDDELDAR